MKAKLVKRSNGRFDLYEIKDVDQLNTIASSFDNPKGKLSLKNCQEIERSYDLDELAKVFHEQHKFASSHIADITSFKLGFQKALELMGDKKFSEEDIDEAFDAGHEMLDSPKNYNDVLNSFKESLQQTEWDVEIEMEYQGLEEDGKLREAYLPKLNADSCLILRKL